MAFVLQAGLKLAFFYQQLHACIQVARCTLLSFLPSFLPPFLASLMCLNGRVRTVSKSFVRLKPRVSGGQGQKKGGLEEVILNLLFERFGRFISFFLNQLF
jgi:hypothetical protein